jgi:hypothetical protein
MITLLKQFKTELFHIYMILALLFLTSVTLHIHTQEAAVSEDHGAAVSISAIAGDLSHEDASGEIVVSPESAIKLEHNDVPLVAVFLLIALIVVQQNRSYIGRLRHSNTGLFAAPFFGAPLLRGPPALNK